MGGNLLIIFNQVKGFTDVSLRLFYIILDRGLFGQGQT